MTPLQYKKAAIALCQSFKPQAEKQWNDHWHEFTFNGWRIGLHLAHRFEFVKALASDWISIGITNPHELPPFCDHWKWNIHYSGPPGDKRVALLAELERRLNRLNDHYEKTKAPSNHPAPGKA